MTLTCRISSTGQITEYEWIHVKYGVNDTQTFNSVQKSTSEVLSIPKEKQLGEWVCRFYNKQQLLGNATYYLQMMSEYCFVYFCKISQKINLNRGHQKYIVIMSIQLYRDKKIHTI